LLVEEPRLVALPTTDPLAGRDFVSLSELEKRFAPTPGPYVWQARGPEGVGALRRSATSRTCFTSWNGARSLRCSPRRSQSASYATRSDIGERPSSCQRASSLRGYANRDRPRSRALCVRRQESQRATRALTRPRTKKPPGRGVLGALRPGVRGLERPAAARGPRSHVRVR
jgi:hypothetical protein